jgi:hypothetical protein
MCETPLAISCGYERQMTPNAATVTADDNQVADEDEMKRKQVLVQLEEQSRVKRWLFAQTRKWPVERILLYEVLLYCRHLVTPNLLASSITTVAENLDHLLPHAQKLFYNRGYQYRFTGSDLAPADRMVDILKSTWLHCETLFSRREKGVGWYPLLGHVRQDAIDGTKVNACIWFQNSVAYLLPLAPLKKGDEVIVANDTENAQRLAQFAQLRTMTPERIATVRNTISSSPFPHATMTVQSAHTNAEINSKTNEPVDAATTSTSTTSTTTTPTSSVDTNATTARSSTKMTPSVDDKVATPSDATTTAASVDTAALSVDVTSVVSSKLPPSVGDTKTTTTTTTTTADVDARAAGVDGGAGGVSLTVGEAWQQVAAWVAEFGRPVIRLLQSGQNGEIGTNGKDSGNDVSDDEKLVEHARRLKTDLMTHIRTRWMLVDHRHQLGHVLDMVRLEFLLIYLHNLCPKPAEQEESVKKNDRKKENWKNESVKNDDGKEVPDLDDFLSSMGIDPLLAPARTAMDNELSADDWQLYQQLSVVANRHFQIFDLAPVLQNDPAALAYQQLWCNPTAILDGNPPLPNESAILSRWTKITKRLARHHPSFHD